MVISTRVDGKVSGTCWKEEFSWIIETNVSDGLFMSVVGPDTPPLIVYFPQLQFIYLFICNGK